VYLISNYCQLHCSRLYRIVHYHITAPCLYENKISYRKQIAHQHSGKSNGISLYT